MNFLWIIPCYAAGIADDLKYLTEAVNSVKAQTDIDWHLLIVDDCSPNASVMDYICNTCNTDHRISCMRVAATGGVANARNLVVRWAQSMGYDVVLFLDTDDIASRNRLADVRRIMTDNPDVCLVYSDFVVIDENTKPWKLKDIVPDLRQINNGHPKEECKFEDIWIDIVTSLGYTNLTSTTSMRTKYIAENPFLEDAFVSEDYYAWLTASAAGCTYYF
ncbi:MAG: glycosyltransferase, partial [Clostridiales bacterium]|nr:glycosyltransferase [Clostridiales bacterium]